MTWDIYAVRPSFGVRRLEDMPEHSALSPLGSPQDVAQQIHDIAPEVEIGDPTWLTTRSDDYSIDIALGKGLQVRDVTFYINSGDAAAVPRVLEICSTLRLRPFDTETGVELTADSTRPEPPPMTEEELKESEKKPWWKLGR